MRNKLMILLSLAGVFLANVARAEGSWTHSVVQLGYDDTATVGGIYQRSESFWAMITCSPNRPVLHIELGFLQDIPFDVEAEIFYFSVGDRDYYFPYVASREPQGFLQVWAPFGANQRPWGGQERMIAAMVAGQEIVLRAAKRTELSQMREVLRMSPPAGGQAFRDLDQACGAGLGVVAPVAAGPTATSAAPVAALSAEQAFDAFLSTFSAELTQACGVAGAQPVFKPGAIQRSSDGARIDVSFRSIGCSGQSHLSEGAGYCSAVGCERRAYLLGPSGYLLQSVARD